MSPPKIDPYTVAWAVWLAAFAAIETAAIVRAERGRPGASLSEHVWKWSGVTPRAPLPRAVVRLRRGLLVGFMSWLTAHIVSGGWA